MGMKVDVFFLHSVVDVVSKDYNSYLDEYLKVLH